MLCRNKSLRREKHFELQKMVRDPGAFMALTSESFSRHSKKCSDAASFQQFWFPNRSCATARCKFCGFKFHKTRNNSIFNDFDFQIALVPQHGANFADLKFKSVPTLPVLNDFDFRIALAPQRGANFGQPILRTRPFLGTDFPSLRSHKTLEKTKRVAQFLTANTSSSHTSQL